MQSQGFWSQAGKAIGRAAVAAGKSVQSAYLSVDPDVRRHVAQLPLLGLTLLSSEPMLRPLPDDGHPPIVLVHGLGGAPGNFAPLRAYLKWHGRKRHYAIAFGADATTIETMAARLAQFLEDVVVVNDLPPDAKIDVVAHSMGGVIARLACEDPRAAARIGNLVTLGTPHAGTWLARWAATPNTLALRPGSDVITRLERQLPWPGPPSRPRLVALWSPSDMILLPHGSAMVEGGENIEMPGFTHYGYLIHRAGWRRVLAAL